MFFDPYSLLVAPGATGVASGELYLDDEATLAHERDGAWQLRRFDFSKGVLSCSSMARGRLGFDSSNTLERVEIAGQKKAPSSARLETGEGQGRTLDFFWDQDRGVVTIKKPDVRVVDDWRIVLTP